MSRIGKHPVAVPAGVTVQVTGQDITVKGKLGQLSLTLVDDISATLEGGALVVKPRTESRKARVNWATSRTLLANMVKGVDAGFTKNLEITGVGYKAAVQGQELLLNLGFSHDVRYQIPAGISMKCDKPTSIAITGFDKQKVGQVAAEIRAYRPPEPYKGKGVKYADEVIIRKEGKKK
ncbi:50S ribosomal protein L6 [Nitrospirillum iridis]|uniref:Large ribosomal subunit protein uL6 n=1 Tax=Nitrospirillum iridis TaxID=765888 RepID=A0A7X0ATV7_9PROT|nr:50S ribosomal protein L6 [Nitrospirillum iridis]MBB6250009.1 large subunit ribosomal protein L6 [Nitrospirillum iridis]